MLPSNRMALFRFPALKIESNAPEKEEKRDMFNASAVVSASIILYST